jgi:uncharacterized membrane protein
MTGATLSQRLNDPDSDLVRDALTRKCVLCHATPDTRCTSPINGKPMPDRIVHLARTAP